MAAIMRETAPTSRGWRNSTTAPPEDYPWLSSIRSQAAARLRRSVFRRPRMRPGATQRRRHRFGLLRAGAAGRQRRHAGLLGNFVFGGTDCCNIVFVNGFYSANLSTPGVLPRAFMRAAWPRHCNRSRRNRALSRPACRLSDECVRRLEYRLHAGRRLHLAASGATLQKVIHLIFISTAAGRGTASYPRNLIVAAAAARRAW